MGFIDIHKPRNKCYIRTPQQPNGPFLPQPHHPKGDRIRMRPLSVLRHTGARASNKQVAALAARTTPPGGVATPVGQRPLLLSVDDDDINQEVTLGGRAGSIRATCAASAFRKEGRASSRSAGRNLSEPGRTRSTSPQVGGRVRADLG